MAQLLIGTKVIVVKHDNQGGPPVGATGMIDTPPDYYKTTDPWSTVRFDTWRGGWGPENNFWNVDVDEIRMLKSDIAKKFL